jgi:voltage-gated sodium channel type II alpha
MLNMITMALEHYEQPEDFEHGLFYVNTAFIIIFTTECLLKLISLRWYYFKQPWNVFDFIVVVVSILGKQFSLRLVSILSLLILFFLQNNDIAD